MRIWLLILLIFSTSFTQAAFAMPAMSSVMSMTDMTMTLEHDHADHRKSMGEASSVAQHHDTQSAVIHCICIMCFPALATSDILLQQAATETLPLPLNGAKLLPNGPEPLSPPPRLG